MVESATLTLRHGPKPVNRFPKAVSSYGIGPSGVNASKGTLYIALSTCSSS
mgnify:CR=1 FL=1